MQIRFAYYTTFPARGFIEHTRTGEPVTYSRRRNAVRRKDSNDPYGIARVVEVHVYQPGEHPKVPDNGMMTYEMV